MLKNEKPANRNEHQNRKTDLKNSQNRKTENPNVPLVDVLGVVAVLFSPSKAVYGVVRPPKQKRI